MCLVENGYGKGAFPIGTRVELHPRFDEWMMGDKFGVVIFPAFVTPSVYVRLDSGRLLRVEGVEDLRHA